ncbi:MAG: YeiH family protein [Maricaulaceae bacterium]
MIQTFRSYGPGFVFCALLGVAALALSEVSNIPVMMLALIFGLCFHKLSTTPSLCKGVGWTSRKLLYIGVALLGLRIDISDLSQAGWAASAFVFAALALTLLFGTFTARVFGENRQFGLLMGGSVAICGISAAAAICSAMDDCESRDRELTITIAGITGLSTIAMILYPLVAHNLSLTAAQTGLFLGGSIHNVSQAVGAGYSLTPETGDITVIFKLLRVSALLPVIICISLVSGTVSKLQNPSLGKKISAYFPPFLMAFIGLAALSCFNVVPDTVTQIGNDTAKWCLIISLVAIGIKTNLRDVFTHGKKPLLAMTLTTAFMAGIILLGIYTLPII